MKEKYERKVGLIPIFNKIQYIIDLKCNSDLKITFFLGGFGHILLFFLPWYLKIVYYSKDTICIYRLLCNGFHRILVQQANEALLSHVPVHVLYTLPKLNT